MGEGLGGRGSLEAKRLFVESDLHDETEWNVATDAVLLLVFRPAATAAARSSTVLPL